MLTERVAVDAVSREVPGAEKALYRKTVKFTHEWHRRSSLL